MNTETTSRAAVVPPAIAAEDRSDLPLDRSALMARLKALQPELVARGIEGLFLFGSYARDEADAYSDLDIFVDVGAGFTLIELLQVQHLIEDEFDVHVDVTTRASLGAIEKAAERDAVRVF